MKKTLLTATVLSVAFWLSGCMVISCEKHGPPKRHIARAPVVEVVDVVAVPGPRLHRHGHPHGPHGRW